MARASRRVSGLRQAKPTSGEDIVAAAHWRLDPSAANRDWVQNIAADSTGSENSNEPSESFPNEYKNETNDGEGRAWLVVFGGFIDMVTAFGLLNSFGSFQARYAQLWGLRISAVSWIGSTQLFFLFLGGLVVGPSFDKWGARPVMLAGTLLCLLSLVLTSFASEYYQILLAQGVLFGAGNALLLYPATGAISQWFHDRRGLALGVAVAGSSVGGIIWPLVLDKLFHKLSEPWALRTVALICVPTLLASCLLVKEPHRAASHDTRLSEGILDRHAFVTAILDIQFLVLSAALALIYCGMLVPFYYIPTFAMDHFIQANFANGLLSISYAGSAVGRVLSGWLSDNFGRFNVLAMTAVGTSIVTFCSPWMTSFPAITLFALAFGMFSGGLIPLGSACVAQVTQDLQHVGHRIGTMMGICSIGALIGGPISGAIQDSTGRWEGVFAYSATMTLVGAVVLVAAKVVLRRHCRLRQTS